MKSPQFPSISRRTTVAALLLSCAFAGTISTARAQDYPFSLPANFEASINIDETKKEPVNNGIMGVNMTSVRAFASNQGFADKDTRTIIKKISPASMRFPGGAPTNTYNFRNDTDTPSKPDRKVGVDGLIALSKELGMEVMWTFNVTKDNAADAVENLAQLRARGAVVENIELGNELFWGQDDRVVLDKNVREIAAALHKVDPSLKISLPISWRCGAVNDKINHNDRNSAFTRVGGKIDGVLDVDYFDAITVHRYIHKAGRSPKIGDPAPTPEDYKDLLTAGKNILDDTQASRDVFGPGKDVWLTEWGVSGGANDGVNAASYLGGADAYLMMFDHQDIFTQANWFQVNSYDEFLRGTRDLQTKKLSVTTTGFLDMFEIVQDVFRNSQLLGGDVAAPYLIPVSAENPNGSQAISAKATMKDGKMKILAVNKTDKDVKFTINDGNQPRARKYRFETLKYDSLSDEGKMPALDLSNSKPVPRQTEVMLPGGTGDAISSVILPKFSMSIISDSQG